VAGRQEKNQHNQYDKKQYQPQQKITINAKEKVSREKWDKEKMLKKSGQNTVVGVKQKVGAQKRSLGGKAKKGGGGKGASPGPRSKPFPTVGWRRASTREKRQEPGRRRKSVSGWGIIKRGVKKKTPTTNGKTCHRKVFASKGGAKKKKWGNKSSGANDNRRDRVKNWGGQKLTGRPLRLSLQPEIRAQKNNKANWESSDRNSTQGGGGTKWGWGQPKKSLRTLTED